MASTHHFWYWVALRLPDCRPRPRPPARRGRLGFSSGLPGCNPSSDLGCEPTRAPWRDLPSSRELPGPFKTPPGAAAKTRALMALRLADDRIRYWTLGVDASSGSIAAKCRRPPPGVAVWRSGCGLRVHSGLTLLRGGPEAADTPRCFLAKTRC